MRSETRQVCEADFAVVNGLILRSFSLVLTTFGSCWDRNTSTVVLDHDLWVPFQMSWWHHHFRMFVVCHFDLLCELNIDQVWDSNGQFRIKTAMTSFDSYQPINSLRSFWNWSRGNGLVNRSASCKVVSTLTTLISLFKCDLNQCTRTS